MFLRPACPPNCNEEFSRNQHMNTSEATRISYVYIRTSLYKILWGTSYVVILQLTPGKDSVVSYTVRSPNKYDISHVYRRKASTAVQTCHHT